MNPARSLIPSAVLFAFALASSLAAQTAGNFTLDLTGATTAKVGYYPVRVELLTTRPEGVTKEPVYAGTPKYGIFHVGNGPRSTHFLALDEPAGGTWKIYVDLKGDGDLTSSGDGAWSAHRTGVREMYGINQYVVRASYGTPSQETSAGDYGVAIYHFVDRGLLFMYRETARRGTVMVDGQPHAALLAENDADGLYSKPLDEDGKPVSGVPSRPVWLLLDTNNDGKWSPPMDVRSPFKLGEKTYVADLAPDGSAITLAETTRQVPVPKTPAAKPLLTAGTPAPDFEAEAWGGGVIDFKGKVVLLDFWATWCGPCQKSLPHIEQLYQVTKEQNVVVLGLCDWDDREAYAKWVPANQDHYHYALAFDPAGKATEKGIASAKYQVSGIPTTYLIDADGKVAATIVGYQDGDKRIEEALGKLGVSTAPSAPMTAELMARLIKFLHEQKDTDSMNAKLAQVLGLGDGRSNLPLKLVQSDVTGAEHSVGVPVDAESKDVLFIVKRGTVIEAYLTDRDCTLRGAAVLEGSSAHLVLNEQAEKKFQAEVRLFAGEALINLPPVPESETKSAK